jgi:hypothetical protein
LIGLRFGLGFPQKDGEISGTIKGAMGVLLYLSKEVLFLRGLFANYSSLGIWHLAFGIGNLLFVFFFPFNTTVQVEKINSSI